MSARTKDVVFDIGWLRDMRPVRVGRRRVLWLMLDRRARLLAADQQVVVVVVVVVVVCVCVCE